MSDPKQVIVTTEPCSCGLVQATFARHHDFPETREVRASAHAVESEAAPAPIILDLVRQLDAGLLVMGPYGQGALRELFFGSVTRTMLRECPVPLFLFH